MAKLIKTHQYTRNDLDSILCYLEKLNFYTESDSSKEESLTKNLTELKSLIIRLKDRTHLLKSDPPLVLALIGPTGVGKSKVFNSLLKKPLSSSSYKRPNTIIPVLATTLHELFKFNQDLFLAPYKKSIVINDVIDFNANNINQNNELQLYLSPNGIYRNIALIDTPDFDSISSFNRKVAIDISKRADALIIVADGNKYADLSLWEFINDIKESQKPTLILLNRLPVLADSSIENSPIALDFKQRLEEFDCQFPLIIWPEEANLADSALINLDFSGGKEVLDWISNLRAEKTEILNFNLNQEARKLSYSLNDLIKILKQKDCEYLRLKEMTQDLFEKATLGLKDKLTINISTEVREALLENLKKLFNRFDPLAKPRKFLMAPFIGLKNVLQKHLSKKFKKPNFAEINNITEVKNIFANGNEALLLANRQFSEQLSYCFKSSTILAELVKQDNFKNLDFTPDEIRIYYQKTHDDLEHWVSLETQKLVENLGLGEKAAFYVAQLVTMALIISLQVQTGGGFSLLEGLLDGFMAPILAKIAGTAMSKEKIKELEIKAAEKHYQNGYNLLKEQFKRYQDFLNQAHKGLEALEQLNEYSLQSDGVVH